MMPPAIRTPIKLAAMLGFCAVLAACGPAYRDYGGGYGPSYGSYYDPSYSSAPSYYAPSYSRSYRSYSAPYYAPRYEPRYEPRYSRGSWCRRDGGPCDRDDNPPGPRGGPGTNWENPPGPAGGPGASSNRRSWNSVDRDRDGRPDWWDRRR